MKIIFSKKLKELREKLNMEQSEIAHQLRFSVTLYRELEEGKRYVPLASLKKISNCFFANPFYLLFGVVGITSHSKLRLTAEDTFGAWFYKWVFSKSEQVNFGQISSYSSMSQSVLPVFADIRLCDITWEDVNAYLSTKKYLAAKTAKDHRTLIKQVFDFAGRCRVINYNPAVGAYVPKECAKAIETATISPKMQKMVFETSHEMQLAAVIMLLAGLRRGELLALTFKDIHLNEEDTSSITVKRVVELQNDHPSLQERAKTENGVREIMIEKNLYHFIKEYKKRYPLKKDDDYIISDENGLPLTGKKFRNKWKDYIANLNAKYGDFPLLPFEDIDKLPMRIMPFTSKCLRHTYATNLYIANTDVVTAKDQLGHSKVSTTLDFYTHLDSVFKQSSINNYQNMMSKLFNE